MKLLSRFCKLFLGKFYLIVVLGPDGSGKSTLIDNLIKKYQQYGTNYYSHLYPKLYKYKSLKKAVYPYSKKPYPVFIGDLKIIYMFLRNIFCLFNVSFKLKNNSSILWCDRYFFDVFADPLRYRIDKTFLNYKFLNKLVRRPDVIIILNPPLSSILKRSTEISEKELKKQINSYNNLKLIFQDSLLISSEKDINQTIEESEDYINKKFFK